MLVMAYFDGKPLRRLYHAVVPESILHQGRPIRPFVAGVGEEIPQQDLYQCQTGACKGLAVR